MIAFEPVLSELRDALGEFIVLLEAESEALTAPHPEQLARVVDEKATWAERAGHAWRRLEEATRGETGFPAADFERAFAEPPAVNRLWTEIKGLAGRAAQLNQANNVMIEAQLRRTRQALDVLQNAARRGNLYGADGQLVGAIPTLHTLDKA